MKKKHVLVCGYIFLLLVSGVLGLAEQTAKGIADGVIRLHVIANSDSEDDQTIKLRVRDAILEMGEQNIQAYADAANRVLAECGAGYRATAEYGKFYFPTKEYDGFSFPAGEYQGIRVVLGKGAGQNWWCVFSPPMCFSACYGGTFSDEAQRELKESLSSAAFSVIDTEQVRFRPAFRAIELLGELKEWGSQKLLFHEKP